MPASETLRIEKTANLHDSYVTAGNRAYVIGAQDGSFPDIGFHIPGEMGGVWAHPIKLLDGFWLAVDGNWLSASSTFISGPFWSEQRYIMPHNLQVVRRQFAPDGEAAVTVRYTFTSPHARRVSIRLLARTDLRRVWSLHPASEPASPPQTSYDPATGAWTACSHEHPWAVMLGACEHGPIAWRAGTDLWGPQSTQGTGSSLLLDYELTLSSSRSAVIEFVICGSAYGEHKAREIYERVSSQIDSLWQAKSARLSGLLEQTQLDVPDHSIQRAWDWLKCNYDWLHSDVLASNGGFTAGMPEYPWWFGCDNAYAVLGALALGQHGRALETLDLLRTVSEQAHAPVSRVIHEYTTAAEVAAPGSSAETPHLISTIWQAFCWTGDLEFLQRNYDFCRRGLLDWTLGTQCPDGDLLPSGYGITEQLGFDLKCIDTAAHTVSAVSALAGMARVMADDATAARCQALEPLIRARLDEAFWMEEEGLYGDIIASPAEMIPRLHQWQTVAEGVYYRSGHDSNLQEYLLRLLDQAQADPDADRRRPWLLKHWIILSPIEAGISPHHRATRALTRLQSHEFVGSAGMYLSGLERAHVMSISTGTLASAAILYGAPDQGVEYLRRLTDTLDCHMPGAISEILPDGGCFVQAWSGYAVVWPVVARMFGIQPDAHRRQITTTPRFPANWAGASLRHVRIGDSIFDFRWDGSSIQIETKDSGWRFYSGQESSVP